MKQQNLEKEIQNLAQKFRLRAKRGYSDDKRHDRVRRDESKAMLKAEHKFGLTPPKIAEVFQRDVRTVVDKLREAKEEPEKLEKLERAVGACLQMESPYASFVSEPLRGPTGRYLRTKVWNQGVRMARRCWGYLRLRSASDISRGQKEFKLHWWGTPFRGVEIPDFVDIPPGHHHILDIAFSLPRPGFQPQVRGVTSGDVSVITTTFDEDAPNEPLSAFEGCLIATNLALARPDPKSDFHLSPGTHEIEVSVGCEDGSGDYKLIKLISAQSWEGLDCQPLDGDVF